MTWGRSYRLRSDKSDKSPSFNCRILGQVDQENQAMKEVDLPDSGWEVEN
jgi:hypothetical protein